MYPESVSPTGDPARLRFATTLFVSGWGASSACLFFRALLIQHDGLLCFAALISLVIVWAALERKRWGRLALFGLCLLALIMFVSSLLPDTAGIARDAGLPTPTLAHHIQAALDHYTQSPLWTAAVGLLSACTGVWLCCKPVVAEFEQGKRMALAPGQRTIALTLVILWAMALLLLPHAIDTGSDEGGNLTARPDAAPTQAVLRAN